MWPDKIKNFVRTLIERTEAGDFNWYYQDDDQIVSIDIKEFYASLKYSYNGEEGVGEFVFSYFDKATQKEYQFYTNQQWREYDIARRLYSSAQASNLQLPF